MKSSWLWLAATAVLVSGCSTSPSWRQVEPGTLQPASLAGAGDQLLVGGSTSGAPAMAVITAIGQASLLALHPDGPEAEAAELVKLAVHGDQVQALGTMISGAHSNPRWTVWDGSLAANSMTSHPQEFFTFGGHDAGPLLGVDWVAAQPTILGSRTTASGARAALYQSTGPTWRESSEGPAELASTKTSQLGFSALASSGEQLVIAGDEVLLTQPLQQRPLVWVGSPGGAWTRLEPTIAGVQGSGLARAQAVTCSADGGTCWVAGWVHRQLLTWTITTGANPSVGPAEAPTRSATGTASGSTDPVPEIGLWQGRPVLAGNGPQADLFVRCNAGWRELPLPGDGSITVQPGQSNSPGPSAQTTVRAMAAVGDRLYVLIDRTLWQIDRGPC